ncbi:MAG: carboxypeptidase regulatory-like domain-containing protein [Thermoanaerobaculia bacterium]
MTLRTACAWIAVLVATSLEASVSGRVTAADGKPLPSIEVLAVRPQSGADLRRGVAPEIVAKTVTDAGGSFSLDVNGLSALRIRAAGYAPFDAAVSDGEQLGTVRLEAAPPMTGRVRANGKPVAAARVIAWAGESAVMVTTDASGAYQLPDPKRWAQGVLVHHADFAPAMHPPVSLDFELETGRLVKGRVVDADGKPAARAKVKIDELQTTTTAADGTFTLPHVSKDAMVIEASAPGAMVVDGLAGGEPLIRMQPAARVRGTVRDESGKPLAGIRLAMFGNGFGGGELVTGGDGGFSVPAVPKGEFALTSVSHVWDIEETVVDTTRGDAEVKLTAKRTPAVTITVLDPKGQPLAGVPLFLSLKRSNGFDSFNPTGRLTGGNGAASVHALSDPTITTTVVAIPPGMPPAFQKITAPVSELTIAVPAGEPLAGSVRDPEGKPIAGARVVPVIGLERANRMAIYGASMQSQGFGWTETGGDGRFTGRLVAGSTVLQFRAEGFLPTQKTIDVAVGMAPVDVQLARAARVNGIVVDEEGKPVAEVPVELNGAVRFTLRDGTFQFDGLEKGAATLHFGRQGDERSIDVPARDLRLVLEASQELVGKVVDAVTGRPLESFVVTVALPSGRENVQPISSPDGSFSVEYLPRSVVSVGAPGYGLLQKVDVSVKPLVIALEPGRKIRGRITDAQKQPIAGAAVSSTNETAFLQEEEGQVSAADGSYEISGLDPLVMAQLTFSKEGFVPQEQTVNAGKDDAVLDVVLARGVLVTGRVVRADGSAAAEVMVSASSPSHGTRWDSAMTDAAGVFRFTDLAPGRYDFAVRRTADGERGGVRDVEIDKPREVAIRLEKLPRGTLAGRVLGADQATSPIAVMASNADGDGTSAMAGPTGEFRLEDSPVGIVEVYAYCSTATGERTTRKETVDLAAGAVAQVDLRFPSRARVHGVAARAGSPAPGLEIRFSGQTDGRAVSGRDGTYSVELDPGEYDVTAWLNGQKLPFAQRLALTAERRFDVPIGEASIRATVVDEAGAPVRYAVIRISQPREPGWSAMSSTEADGVAVLEVIAGEPLNVVVERSGYANVLKEVTVSGPTPMTFRLMRSDGAFVRLVDSRDGRTLAGYVVARDRAGRVVASASRQDANGMTHLALAAGDYEISASAEGYGSQTIAVQIPAKGEIRLPLPRGGSLALRTANGLRGTARLLQPDGREYIRCWCDGIAVTQITGALTIVDRIAPGSYSLEITSENHGPRRIPVTVIEGETVPVVLD